MNRGLKLLKTDTPEARENYLLLLIAFIIILKKEENCRSMISEIKVNPETGWVTESAVEQKMSGTTYILDGAQMPGGLEMPISFTTTIAVTGK